MKGEEGPCVMGIDVGGANLKAVKVDAHRAISCHSKPYELWRNPEGLTDHLVTWLREIGELSDPPNCVTTTLAVTMTGELADGFESRHEGVDQIVRSCRKAAMRLGMPVVFYSTEGRFIPEGEEYCWWRLAASNWHASASWIKLTEDLSEKETRRCWMIDVGSTTTDIIPIHDVASLSDSCIGRTDFERLKCGTLVYLGVGRTPVTSLMSEVTLEPKGSPIPMMREFFATIDDALLVLDRVEGACSADDITADGRPRTKDYACKRLARMLGLDVSWNGTNGFTLHDPTCKRLPSSSDWFLQYAKQIVHRAESILEMKLKQIEPDDFVYLVGHGATLLDQWLSTREDNKTVALANHLGTEVTRCFPAYAVARLFASGFGLGD